MSKQNREVNRTARAAEIRAAQERKERNRRIALIAGIVVVLGAIVAGGAWYTSGGGSKSTNDSVVVAAGPGAVIVGPSTAPVKVTVYEDFQCPYCRQLEDSTRDFLRENAAAGKVQVEYHPINLLSTLPYSARGMNAFAAVLAHSTPKAALKLHDLLYDNQPYESASGSVSLSDIAGYVKQAGGDNAAVQTALQTPDTAFFDAAATLMKDKDITGTPTVYLDGKRITGSMDQMASQIENAVSGG